MEGYKYWGWKNEELIPLAREGDEDAYKQLFHNLKPISIHMAILYGDKMPIYDMDDFIQEGQILIWKLVTRNRPVTGNFATYFSAAVRYRFINMYYHYCQHNMIVLHEKECGNYNTAILVVSDYLDRKRKKESERSKVYRKKHAEEIRIRQMEYRLLHREELNAKKRLYMRYQRVIAPEAVNSRKREYWQKHKDELNAKRRAFRNANKERVYAQNKAYRDTHKEEINSRRRILRNENKAKLAEQQHAYYLRHKEALKAYHKKYREEHREEINARCRKNNAFGGELIETNHGLAEMNVNKAEVRL